MPCAPHRRRAIRIFAAPARPDARRYEHAIPDTTPAAILLSAGDANTFDVAVARLGFTLIGIALASGLMALVWAIQHERRTFRSRSA
jgi:hypothetical protein